MKKTNWIFWFAVILLLLTALISEFRGEEKIKELTIFGCEDSSALNAVLESGRVDTVNIFCPPKVANETK